MHLPRLFVESLSRNFDQEIPSLSITQKLLTILLTSMQKKSPMNFIREHDLLDKYNTWREWTKKDRSEYHRERYRRKKQESLVRMIEEKFKRLRFDARDI